jgi:16S rRNA (uracil1498-N3)-methyltransferase
MDGQGHQAWVTLRTRGGTVRIEYLEPSEKSQTLIRKDQTSLPLILEMAVLKGDAMEWVVEKSVELGIKQLVPVLTAHTVVQMKSKGPEAFQERWQKIADQALKQCGRLEHLHIDLPIPLERLLAETASSTDSVRIWCDEASQGETPYISQWLQTQENPPYTSWRILIGPEGGWSSAERELLKKESAISHQQRIDLGPLILRAETAALFASSIVAAYLRPKSSIKTMQN